MFCSKNNLCAVSVDEAILEVMTASMDCLQTLQVPRAVIGKH
jgi:hypothetical protein